MELWQAVIRASRSLRRAPLFSAAVVLTLTIGIGVAATIFTVVDAVLLRPLPYGHPDQLVGTWHDLPALSVSHAPQTAGTYWTYKRFAHSIEDIAIYDDGSINVSNTDGRDPERLGAIWSTANLFSLLQVQPLLGRTYTAAEDAPGGGNVAVISEALWRTRFGGDSAILGRTVLVSGRLTTIIGVMPASFQFPDAEAELWLPRQLDPNDPYPGGFNHAGIARIKRGVTPEAVQRDFAAVLPRMTEVAPMLAPGIPTSMLLEQAKPIPRIIPLRDDVVGDVARTIWMVAATGVLVLLVTCANVANLLLVRADGRHRELAVRAALGAGRTRVLAHFITESALLTGVAVLLGLAGAAVAIHLLVTSVPLQIPRLSEVHIDATTVLFTLVMGALVALACSAIPAIRFLRAGALSGLRDGGRADTAGGHRQRVRGLLVAGQMAIALAVLATSTLLLRSAQRLRAVHPGFNPEGIATLWLSLPSVRYPSDSGVVRFYAQLAERASHLPGVQSVGLTTRLPLENYGIDWDPIWVEGEENSRTVPPVQLFSSVDAGYFRTMQIPLLAGRLFDPIERQRPHQAIIGQETARHFFHDSTGRAALGRRFQALPGGPWYEVIGVVGGVRDTSLAAPPARTVYFSESVSGDTLQNRLGRTVALVARTSGNVTTVTRQLQALVREVDPTLPTFHVRSMQRIVDASTARLAFTVVIVGAAAVVTLVLGVIGLYGVIAYVVTLRTRELGVRLALGAQPRAVEAMVTAQGLRLSILGAVVGLAAVAVSGRFLRAFLYEISPTDPLALGLATAALVGLALAASWLPARRAARVNPVDALRAD